MDIVLTQYERRSLYRFLGFYICSFSILVCLIAFLIFSIQKSQIYDDVYNKMLIQSSKIIQMIIYEHMSGSAVLSKEIFSNFESNNIEFTLFDSNKNRIYGDLDFIDSNDNFFIDGYTAFLLDSGAYGHLGVTWMLMKMDFTDDINRLLVYLISITILCMLFIVIFGFVLGKMFLRPINQGVELLDSFIKDITHELNTPISALIMSIDSLKHGINDKKISRINKSCRRIQFLYNNLTFLFLGEIHIFKEHIDLSMLLENRIEMFEEHIHSKSINISLNICAGIHLYSDRESVTRLIDNLISNAIKYNIESGYIDISLNSNELCIKNSGTPIPKELRHIIKKRYFRAGIYIKGYGIGLDIVNKVVASHNWRMDIDYANNLNIFKIIF